MQIAERYHDQIDEAQRRKMAFERIDELGIDPLLHQAQIMRDELECRYCDKNQQVPETRWVALMNITDIDVMRDASPNTMVTCPECGGTGYRQVTVSEMMNAGKALMKKTDPDLAAHRMIPDAQKLPLVRRLYNENSVGRFINSDKPSGHFTSMRKAIEQIKPFDEPFETAKITDNPDHIEDADLFNEDTANEKAGGVPNNEPFHAQEEKVPNLKRRTIPQPTDHIPKPKPFNPQESAEPDNDDIEVYWPT